MALLTPAQVALLPIEDRDLWSWWNRRMGESFEPRAATLKAPSARSGGPIDDARTKPAGAAAPAAARETTGGQKAHGGHLLPARSDEHVHRWRPATLYIETHTPTPDRFVAQQCACGRIRSGLIWADATYKAPRVGS